jgi:dTDP-glucose 4,6-dehydratase
MEQSSKGLFGLAGADLAEAAGAGGETLGGARIFLTGGTGFFGKWLLGTFGWLHAERRAGVEVTVLSRDPAAFLARHPAVADAPWLHFVPGQVAEFSLGAQRFDFVIHAATDTTAVADPAREEERVRAIVEGTRRVLDFARACGARRVLNISSGGVYGAPAGRFTGAREDDAPEPVTSYGRAKRAAEIVCDESGLDVVTARAFAFLGPHLPLDAHFAAGNFLRDARRGGPIRLQGDGSAVRSYLYPADLVDWLLTLLLRGRPGAAYNVGSDESVTTAELARRIAAACRPPPEVMIQAGTGPGPQNRYLPDITRARTELGLDVRIDLDEAIRRTLAWLR